MHKCKLANKIRSNKIQFKIDEKEVLVENKKLNGDDKRYINEIKRG